MGTLFDHVRSGDLITADFVNRLLDEVQSLDNRVTLLEAGGGAASTGPHISDFSPKSNIHVGDRFQVSGKGFGLPGLNAVTLSGTRIDNFEVARDDLIIFVIPPVFVPTQGAPVTLSITTAKGSDTLQFTLMPFQPTIPTGEMAVTITGPANVTFAPGSFPLAFSVSAITSVDDTYDLLPNVDTVGWSLVVVNSQGQTIQNPTIAVSKSNAQAQPVVVTGNLQLTIPQGASGSAHVTLGLRSHLNQGNLGLTITAADTVIPVNGKIVSNPDITVTPTPLPARFLDPTDGKTVLVPKGATGLSVPFDVTVKSPGTYTLAARFDNDPTNKWHAKADATVPIQTVGTPLTIPITITLDDPAPRANLILRVSNSDQSKITDGTRPVKEQGT